MRLFIGLPFPVELASAISRHARTISLPNVRWTAPESLHLTLVFLGEVPEQTLTSIKLELGDLTAAPFPVRLTNLNTFPRSGTLMAEVEPTPRLLNLQQQIANRMARCGFSPEDRPYHPHLTLGRFHGSLRLTASQRRLPASLQHNFAADTVNLYRSTLTHAGSHYEILSRKRFNAIYRPLPIESLHAQKRPE